MKNGVDQLQGKILKEALEEYKTGQFSKRVLRPKSLKQRKNFSLRFEEFFVGNGWIFNLETARKLLDTFQITLPRIDKAGKPHGGGKEAAKSSQATYVTKIRAFNQHCIARGYLKENFCQWLQKPPDAETHPEPVHMDIDFETLLKAIKIGTTPTKNDRAKKSLKAKIESYAAQLFMFHTGHRSGSMNKLQGADIHFEAEDPYMIIELKGGRRKPFLIPNDDELREILASRKDKKKVFEVSTSVTIAHLRNGLRAQGVQESILKDIDNHTFRRNFVKERHRNGDSDQAIGDAIGDTAETIRKYYLADDPIASKKTINNSRAIRHRQPLMKLFDEITENVRTNMSRDDRVQSPRTSLDDNYFTIRIPITEIGLEELKKA